MNPQASQARQPLTRLSQLLKMGLMLATPLLIPAVGAAMLLYGWTTP